MRWLVFTLLAGCAWRPSPEIIAKYRDTCAAGNGRFSWGANEANSTEVMSKDFWLRCAEQGAVR